MKVVGIGTDIVKIGRVKLAISRHHNFKTRLFTEREITYCESRQRPELHYAMRFAAKEAIAKAIGTGFRNFAFLNIEILKDELGKPFAEVNGHLTEVLKGKKISGFELSISFDHEYAIAFAMAISLELGE